MTEKMSEEFEKLLEHLEERGDAKGLKILLRLGESTDAHFTELFKSYNQVVEMLKAIKALQEEDKK